MALFLRFQEKMPYFCHFLMFLFLKCRFDGVLPFYKQKWPFLLINPRFVAILPVNRLFACFLHFLTVFFMF